MAGFDGFWVDQNGKGIIVSEHWMEVRSNPEKFGLTQAQVDEILRTSKGKFNPGDTSVDGQRFRLLVAAFQNGWTRVRAFRGRYVLEFNGDASKKLPNVIKFLNKAGMGKFSEVELHDLSNGFTQVYEGGNEVLSALKKNKIPDSPVKEIVSSGKKKTTKKDDEGIPDYFSDEQARTMMRQRIGARAKIPDPSPGDEKIEESKLWNFIKRNVYRDQ